MDTKNASNDKESILLDESEAAARLRVSRTTLIRRRKAGEIEHTRLGKKVFYTEQQVANHIAQNAKVETPDSEGQE